MKRFIKNLISEFGILIEIWILLAIIFVISSGEFPPSVTTPSNRIVCANDKQVVKSKRRKMVFFMLDFLIFINNYD